MIELPPSFIVFDTEYTAWEGSQERQWSGPNEYREMVQIAAVAVRGSEYETGEEFVRYMKPIKNPRLSDYFINLTGITQQQVEEKGVPFSQAITEFAAWAGNRPLFCYGADLDRLVENCRFVNSVFPFSTIQFSNVKDVFKVHGIAADDYMSSTIVQAFGVKPTRRGHDALNDVKTIVDALRLL